MTSSTNSSSDKWVKVITDHPGDLPGCARTASSSLDKCSAVAARVTPLTKDFPAGDSVDSRTKLCREIATVLAEEYEAHPDEEVTFVCRPEGTEMTIKGPELRNFIRSLGNSTASAQPTSSNPAPSGSGAEALPSSSGSASAAGNSYGEDFAAKLRKGFAKGL